MPNSWTRRLQEERFMSGSVLKQEKQGPSPWINSKFAQYPGVSCAESVWTKCGKPWASPQHRVCLGRRTMANRWIWTPSPSSLPTSLFPATATSVSVKATTHWCAPRTTVKNAPKLHGLLVMLNVGRTEHRLWRLWVTLSDSQIPAHTDRKTDLVKEIVPLLNHRASVRGVNGRYAKAAPKDDSGSACSPMCQVAASSATWPWMRPACAEENAPLPSRPPHQPAQ
ncbi:uncharacterized protein LOC143288447 [Babylonia areolata]|uniref:uncharacterized protein LOC143288447 n=1 Tax=Babylonia areolata TaxID=304850 RepID=UPI003FCF01B5